MDLLTRNRAPLAVLVLVFLIPIASSSLRGLTHVLSCDDAIGTSITIIPGFEPGEPPVLLSARSLEAGDDPLICGALEVDLGLEAYDEERDEAELVVVIANRSELDWRGTVALELGGAVVPLAVGRIAADDQVEQRTTVRVSGEQFAIEGDLLIGP